MPIDPSIALGIKPVSFANQPFEGLRDVLAIRQAQEQTSESRQRQRSNEIKIQEQQREQAEANAFQQIIAQTGDDWEEADKLLSQHAPGLRQGYLKAVHDARQSKFKAAQEQSAAELAEANVGMGALGIAIDNPALSDVVLAGMKPKFPDLVPLIEQIEAIPADDPRRVEAMKSLRLSGQSAQEQIKREDLWNKDFFEGKFRFAGEAMLMSEDKEAVAKRLFNAGMPRAQVAAIMANPEAFSMTAEERSQEGHRTGQLAETTRGAQAREAEDVRYHNLTTAEQARAHNLQHTATLRGQDLADARAKAGGEGGGKLSVSALEKVAAADTAMESAKTIQGVMGRSTPALGPVAGRAAEMFQQTPFADEGFANFTAEIETLNNSVIKAITGAQMGEPEATRIKGQLPKRMDQPAVFKANLAATMKNTIYLRNRIIQLSGSSEPLLEMPTAPAATATGKPKRVNPY